MRSMQRSGESGRRSLGIYLHVPFCVRKCLYCDFLSAPGDDEMKTEYVEALMREIRGQASLYGGHEVRTVFLGVARLLCFPENRLVLSWNACGRSFLSVGTGWRLLWR